MTDEKMKEMIEDTYLSYGEDLGLSRKVIEKYYYTNWGRGRIEGITMYEDGTIEVEFEDGWEPPPKAVPFGPFLVLGAFQVVLFADFFDSLPIRVSTWLVEVLL